MHQHIAALYKVRSFAFLSTFSWAYLMVMLVIMFGCATTSTGEKSFTMPAHGNFCGPRHPLVETGSKAGNVVGLLDIPVFDDYDNVCRKHDICYEVFGYLTKECDREMAFEIATMKVISANPRQGKHCETFRDIIISSYNSRYMQMVRGVDFDLLNAPFIAIGYTAMAASAGLLTLDNNLKKALGKSDCCRCVRGNRDTNQDKFYYDTLVEILVFYAFIDPCKARAIRNNLEIGNRYTYELRWNHSIQEVMALFSAHPVLSGSWARTEIANRANHTNTQKLPSVANGINKSMNTNPRIDPQSTPDSEKSPSMPKAQAPNPGQIDDLEIFGRTE